ncbi:DUF4258 domain-containing protein [Roseateles depolymerans]|uniref:Uncharacterized protein n=1 Tax=Roseateles depolymerans TaxID=76731 RepID=A0A0U3E0G4_9BURK|nr:DUF4258 domain-containing protein [Roseateles depolymerans]ALV06629.1 hypothetical protein RD2015_2156 [Roseateles depolymerans]REG19605.1 uncharacterized protein DUF4258 [Roseateles depolymerans]
MSLTRLSLQQLQRHIRTQAARTELVFLTTHARKRMAERKVSMAEVLECLRRGSLRTPAEVDVKTGHLICRMNWWGAERDLTTCVALSDDEPSLIVITVIV